MTGPSHRRSFTTGPTTPRHTGRIKGNREGRRGEGQKERAGNRREGPGHHRRRVGTPRGHLHLRKDQVGPLDDVEATADALLHVS